MATTLVTPINKVINQTTTQIIDSELTKKVGGVLNTFITSAFEAVEESLKKIQELTKEEPSS
ncbi:MAG: hypothetical protein EHM91_17195 [Planctomycetota bacterium]|nr:MAG: hypothetical protein EHM91_17195 [Planctomycetota bacterium]